MVCLVASSGGNAPSDGLRREKSINLKTDLRFSHMISFAGSIESSIMESSTHDCLVFRLTLLSEAGDSLSFSA